LTRPTLSGSAASSFQATIASGAETASLIPSRGTWPTHLSSGDPRWSQPQSRLVWDPFPIREQGDPRSRSRESARPTRDLV